MSEAAPAAYAAIPLISCILLAVLTAYAAVAARRAGRRVRPGQIAWPAVFAALLAVPGIWCALGLLEAACGWVTLLAYSAAMLALGAGTLVRRRLFALLDRMGAPSAHAVRAARDVAALALSSVLSAYALELAWNDAFTELRLYYFAVSVAVVAAVTVLLYFLGLRTGVLASLVPVACTALGIAQHFVLSFKAAAILPSDLLAVGTAAAVSAGYTYVLTERIVLSLFLCGLSLFLLSLIWPGRPADARRRAAGALADLALAGAVAGCLAAAYGSVGMEEDLGLVYDRWMPVATYRTGGFIPSFIAVAQDLPIPVPEGYSDDGARDALARLAAAYDAGAGASPERAEAVAQFEELKPTVIAVMDESFADLSVFEALAEAGYPGTVRLNSLPDALQRGALLTSVHGGGTANSEFEFLTGDSIAFVGTGKYPYQLYDLSDVDSLPRQLAGLGYATHAIHPQLGGNWNRETVYREMGFETFSTIEDFEGEPFFHAGNTDRSTYDRILDLLSEDDGPQFIFDVTMQNHGGYDAGTVPEDQLSSWAPAGVADENLLAQLNVYLTCAVASDRDLASFIEDLRALDRPVVLVFFGDHQPSVSSALNDALYPGEDPQAHQWRIYRSSYLVWANYDVAGNPQASATEEIGAAGLAAQVLHLIGAPLTDYQKALVASRAEIPALSAMGYRGADGVAYALDAEGPYRSLVDDLRTIQYLHFARRVR